MRKILFAGMLMLSATSCVSVGQTDDALATDMCRDKAEIVLGVEIDGCRTGEQVKSILDEDLIEDRLTDLTVAVYEEDGGVVDVQYYDDLSDIKVYVRKDCDNTVYALANMGDMTGAMPQRMEDVSKVTYMLRSFSEVGEKGIPMAAVMPVNVSMDRPVIRLERLFAKVNLRILHTSLENASTNMLFAYTVCNISSYVRQANSRLFPFAESGSRALGETDIMGESDYEPDLNDFDAATEFYHPSELGPGPGYFQDTTIVFYVPENMQGRLLPMNDDPMKKTADNIREVNGKDYSGLCSYIELNVNKPGGGTGLSGSLTYRCYLGKDDVSDFDVERNTVYDVTLDLTDDGFGIDNWKVSKGEDWRDTRTLQFLEDSYTIYPGKTLDVFVHYHRMVGVEYGSESRPDDWTYIFDEEGMKAAGLSFTFNPNALGIGPGSKKYFRFAFAASSTAKIGAGFRMTIMSKDGALKDEAMIYVSELGSLSLDWSFYPQYVSQFGEITVKGVPQSLYPLSVSVTDQSVLGCTKSDDDTFRIVARKPGVSTLTFRNRDGSQTYSATLEIKTPIIETTTVNIALNPDGSPVRLDYRYTDNRGVEITNTDSEAFRKSLLPVISGAGYFVASADEEEVAVTINSLYDSGRQINLGSNYDLTIRAVDCAGSGSRPLRVYVVDPFDDVSSVRFGRIDDYTLFAGTGTAQVLKTAFKPQIDRNSTFKVGVPRPDARQDCVSVELQPRWKSGYSNENGVYSVSYDHDDRSYASGASVTVSQNASYSTMKHGAGKHDVMLYVTNSHSKEKIGASAGYFDIYVHTALGAKAVFGSMACNYKPAGSGSFTQSFAEVYNSIAGKTLFSSSSADKIYYMDVSAEFMTDISNVHVFERLVAGAGTYNEKYDALKVMQPNVADGYVDSDKRLLYSVGYGGFRTTVAGETAANRKGIGVLLYRALRLQTYNYSVQQSDLNSWFLGFSGSAASGSYKARFDLHDMMRGTDMNGNIVKRDSPFYFAPSDYPSYLDDEGKGYHVIHFLEDIKPETAGWINLL